MCAGVVALAHALGGVMRLPEDLEQRGVGDQRGLKREPHDFVMPGHARADLFIVRIGRITAGIARRGRVNTRQFPEAPFRAPETAQAKQRQLTIRRKRRPQRMAMDIMPVFDPHGRVTAGQGLGGRGQGRFFSQAG